MIECLTPRESKPTIIIIMNCKILDSPDKQELIDLRQTPFLSYHYCQSHMSASRCLKYKLRGLADPYLALLDVYRMLSLPTTQLQTKQLMQFMIRCVKQYKAEGKINELQCDFFPQKSSLVDLRIIMKQLSKLTEQELKQFNLSKYTAASNFFPTQLCKMQNLQYFYKCSEECLKQYKIIPRSIKLIKINQFSQRLKGKIIQNVRKQYVEIEMESKYRITKIMTLEQLFQNQWKVKLSVGIIQQMYTLLLYQIINFLTLFRKQFFQEKSKAYINVHPKNVLIYVEKETSNEIILTQEPIGLDMFSSLLDQLGLQKRPLSLEQKISFTAGSWPPLKQFSFGQTISKMCPEAIKGKIFEFQIESILHWLLITDFLHTIFLTQDKLSVYQTDLSSEAVFKIFLDINREHLSQSTALLMIILELEHKLYSDQIWMYTFYKWGNTMKMIKGQSEIPKDQLFENGKFANAQLVLTNMLSLFYEREEQRLKYIIENNRQIGQIPNVGKIVMLYLLAMYPILQLEINLRQLGYTGQEAVLEDKKYGIKNNYNKLINLACRYVAKIDEVYRNKPNQDPNKKFQQCNPQLFYVYDEVKKFELCAKKLHHQFNQQQHIQNIQLLQKKMQNQIYILIYTQGNVQFDRKVIESKFPGRDYYRNIFNRSKKSKLLPEAYRQLRQLEVFLDLYFDYSLSKHAQYQKMLTDMLNSGQNKGEKDPRKNIDQFFEKLREKMRRKGRVQNKCN